MDEEEASEEIDVDLRWRHILDKVLHDLEIKHLFRDIRQVFETGHGIKDVLSYDENTVEKALLCINPGVSTKESGLVLLIKVLWASLKGRIYCAYCDCSYDVCEPSDAGIRCRECWSPAHMECLVNYVPKGVLPEGLYWVCKHCNDPTDTIHSFTRLLATPDHQQEEVSVKVEPQDILDDFGCGLEDDSEEDIDSADEDDEVECVATKGFLCGVCDFSTFVYRQLQSHLMETHPDEWQSDKNTDEVVKRVQAAISTEEEDGSSKMKACIKCQVRCSGWSPLYGHVIQQHGKHTDFPAFQDEDWKFLVGGGHKLTCGYCHRSFSTKSAWMAHTREGIRMAAKEVPEVKNVEYIGLHDLEDNELLVCNQCAVDSPVFPSVHALKDHTRAFHMKSKRHICPFCDHDADNSADLRSHVDSDHEGNFNQCPECSFRAWALSILRRHILLKHRKVRPYGCRHCDYTSSLKQSVVRHIMAVHYKSKQLLENRETKSEVKKAHQCAFCDFTSDHRTKFQEHLDREHDGNRTKCLECPYKAPVFALLRRHIETIHKGVKRFSCDQCDFRCTTKQSLDRHVRVKHLKLQDLQCPLCDYKTSNPDGLRVHRKTYHREGPIPEDRPGKKFVPSVCRICGLQTRTMSKMAKHFAEYHHGKPFECPECKTLYETHYGLKNHMRKEHSEERHLCAVCGYSTHGPHYLKRHYRRKHPGMVEAVQQGGGLDEKIPLEEKMKVAQELKGLSDEEVSERIRSFINLSEDKVWTCGKCGQRFDNKPKRALYSHIRERHFHMRHFKCKDCNFLSYNRAEIEEHKAKHLKERAIHQCDLCGFISDSNTGLIRHKRGRFCQNSHLKRRKRDRDKIANKEAEQQQDKKLNVAVFDPDPCNQFL